MESDYSAPMFHGGCIGVGLVPRGQNDNHICIELCVEDDENWHRKLNVSSAWLDEMIKVLQQAKAYCDTQEPHVIHNCQLGWKFKDGEP